MPSILLRDRAVLAITGPDAETLLQNIVTTDLDSLGGGEASAGALLTPQGKILFDFVISRRGDGFDLDTRAEIAEDFRRRLLMYRLRARVDFTAAERMSVSVSWRGGEGGAGEAHTPVPAAEGLADRRFPASLAVERRYAPGEGADAVPGLDALTRLRIEHGVAESGADYDLGDAFPHDVNLDQTGGVGLRKGCYVGQEVVSRMQHRGTARRRMLVASAEATLPAPRTPVTVQGRPIGALGSVAGSSGLALVRIDKVKAAMDAGVAVLAGDVAIGLAIPPGAGFRFPEAAAESAD